MPRIPGTGVYEQPAPDVITATTIETAVYNAFVNDVETDLNTPRPIVAGGTGASSAAAARDNLDAERSAQQVTNYDTHVFEAGSFFSNPGATGEPVAGKYTSGICHFVAANSSMVLEARVYDGGNPLESWSRVKWVTWAPWKKEISSGGGTTNEGVTAPIGDIFYGVIGVAPNSSFVVNSESDANGTNYLSILKNGEVRATGAQVEFYLNKTGASNGCGIIGQTGGSNKWNLQVNSGTSNFAVYRYDDAAVMNATPPLEISRTNGNATFAHSVLATNEFAAAGAALGSSPGVGNTNTGFSILAGGILTISRSVGSSGAFNINADGNNIVICRFGTVVGSISVLNTTTSYNTSSDERLKEDLKSFDAGNIIDNTNVYNFKWKASDDRAYGVIAQQAVDVYPTAVTYSKDTDWYGIDYSKYVPVILQELKTLRARVAELEGRLEGKPA